MTHERAGEVYRCADCGREMSKAEGGTVFTVCDKCWNEDKDPHLNPDTSQQAVQWLQAEVKSLLVSAEIRDIENKSLQAEVERWKSEGIKCEQEVLQQLADQRAEIERLKWFETEYPSIMLRLTEQDNQRAAMDGLVAALTLALAYDNDPGSISTWAEMQDKANAALAAAEKILNK